MARRPRFSKRTESERPLRANNGLNMQGMDSGVEKDNLRLTLKTITLTGGPDIRAAILSSLRQTLDGALGAAREKFEEGRLGGLECARLLAAIHDDIITVIFDYATTHIVTAPNPTQSEIMSLCAVGGYGRGEMAPHSDVDLLFLVADKKGSPYTETVTEYVLYMLWDLGLKVGHATRTTDQCLKLAKEDQTILTAMLDLRYLDGDEPLAADLILRFDKDITRGKGRAYIAAKLEERDSRHAREGHTRYVIEPNVKEGKGALRDLHVLYWMARFLDVDGQISDPQKAAGYVAMGLFDQKAATRFMRAADFLWRARIHLHYTSKRPTESLSFDKQTILARKMGHAAGPVEEAVEKFMREYFTNAREVGALTRIACAKLEAANAMRLPKGLDRLLPTARRNMKEDGFVIDHGRLMFDDPLQIRNDPSLIMRLFYIAGKRNLDIHPDAFSEIDYRRNLIDSNFRRDPKIAAIFEKILLKSKAPYALLKLMNEAGVLGRYILEFGGIVARTQFNMHHAYTVDEHTLRLVKYLHDLLVGDLAGENPIATEIVQNLSKTDLMSLYLTCILHDTGKGVGDQCVEGARLSRRACRRLGCSQDQIEVVSWLVHSHLDLSETAQRRDISDPDTIATFSQGIGSLGRLKMLYVLTVVDIRAVGPGIWNDWKGVLLRDLYKASTNYIEGKAELEPVAKAAAIKAQYFERLSDEVKLKIKPITDDMGDPYWSGFPMSALIRHARFFDHIMDGGYPDDIAVQTRRDRDKDITELWILAQDAPGLLSNLTLSVSASGALIIGARLHTGHNGRVMNVFYLQNTDGFAFGRQNDKALETLRRRALQAATGDIKDMRIPDALASKRAGAIPVRSKVRFVDTPSKITTIIEIEGRDRPGLLYGLADCLRQLNLDVLSAHVDNVGEKAVDAFYINCQDSGPLGEGRRAQIKTALKKILTVPALQNAARDNGPDKKKTAA